MGDWGWEVRDERKEKREKGKERREEGEGRKIKENREGRGKRGIFCAHKAYAKPGEKGLEGWRPTPPPPLVNPLRVGISYPFIQR